MCETQSECVIACVRVKSVCACMRLRVCVCARVCDRVKCVCSDLSVDCVQDSGLQSGDGGDSRRSRH